MKDLPAWLQTLLGAGGLSGLVVGIVHFVKLVGPWLVKGGKFAFGLIGKLGADSPQVVNNIYQGLAPPGPAAAAGGAPGLSPATLPPGQAPPAGPPTIPELVQRHEHDELRRLLEDLKREVATMPRPALPQGIVTKRELDEAIDELATSLAEPTDAVTEAQVRPLVQQLVQQLLREYVTLHDFERLTGRIDASEEKAQAFRERVLADTAVILDRVKRTRPAGG